MSECTELLEIDKFHELKIQLWLPPQSVLTKKKQQKI